MPDAYQWLLEWVAENFPASGGPPDQATLAAEAELCRTEAVEDGIDLDELNAACGGDLQAFLRLNADR